MSGRGEERNDKMLAAGFMENYLILINSQVVRNYECTVYIHLSLSTHNCL